MAEFIAGIINEAASWAKGRNYLVRLPFLFWFAYVFIRHLGDPMYSSVLGPLNLGIHELGHFVFSPFGSFIAVMGGTLLQLAAPVAGMINFYIQRDYFAITLCFGWLATNFFDVARYASDARSMSLPLVSPFGMGNVVHDWNYMLGRLGILRLDRMVGFIFRLFAFVSMSACLLSCAWLLYRMYKTTDKETRV